MSKLYLLRHGIALPHGTEGVSDDDRPLTTKGESRVSQIAHGLKRVGVRPDRIVTSPLPRARRTAEIVAKALGLEDAVEDAEELRAGASAGSTAEWLRSRAETALMLVGHNPHLTDLLGLLAGLSGSPPPFELKKGGVASLVRDEQGKYQIQWLATPRLFRRLT